MPSFKRFWLRRYVSVMSLKDSSKKQLFYSSDALYRSKSFGGFLNSYPSSTYIADGDLYSPGMSRKASHGGSRKGWSFTRSAPKLPKVPRPQRTLIIFDSVIKGLRNKIDIMLEDVRSLREKESLDSSQSPRQTRQDI
ncbi:PREDICTED: uncharacterized protein LOC106806365 isoform X2 [Priapulus caudatus]|uniref:Uncharacterized protein LOC106806365 isoform X2 n=1 Tax=Priapulus caudatus TaxID=37621 RepID=A0ABM1DUZ3_PRICU|nr:PREDICTED: uncharacterized protein LOC106806365 isoform X2 [Priapulus caudatus]